VAIVPDQKDWTWVLRRPCPECGFDASGLPREQIAPLVRSTSQAWISILADDPEGLRERTRPDRWSRLEYACHVRDVYRRYDERLRLMLTIDDPTYPNWDQDETAVAERYNDQDPDLVAAQVEEAANSLAARFESVDGPGWERRGFRSDGADFRVESFGRYLVHDPIHHLWDVTGH
jgi:hypothetical protein